MLLYVVIATDSSRLGDLPTVEVFDTEELASKAIFDALEKSKTESSTMGVSFRIQKCYLNNQAGWQESSWQD